MISKKIYFLYLIVINFVYFKLSKNWIKQPIINNFLLIFFNYILNIQYFYIFYFFKRIYVLLSYFFFFRWVINESADWHSWWVKYLYLFDIIYIQNSFLIITLWKTRQIAIIYTFLQDKCTALKLKHFHLYSF